MYHEHSWKGKKNPRGTVTNSYIFPLEVKEHGICFQTQTACDCSGSISLQVLMLIIGLYICSAVHVVLFASASCAGLFLCSRECLQLQECCRNRMSGSKNWGNPSWVAALNVTIYPASLRQSSQKGVMLHGLLITC